MSAATLNCTHVAVVDMPDLGQIRYGEDVALGEAVERPQRVLKHGARVTDLQEIHALRLKLGKGGLGE